MSRIVSCEEFESFRQKYGCPSRPSYSFTGKASCPTSAMVRYLTVKGEAVKHITYKRGKVIETTYEIPTELT